MKSKIAAMFRSEMTNSASVGRKDTQVETHARLFPKPMACSYSPP